MKRCCSKTDVFKVFDWFRILFENRVNTIRSVFIYGKEREPQEKIFYNREKNFTLLRGFHSKNTFLEISRNLIRKGCFK